MGSKKDEILAAVKSFGMTNQMILEDLSKISVDFQLELSHLQTRASKAEDTYFSQFRAEIRAEARRMSTHYESSIASSARCGSL